MAKIKLKKASNRAYYGIITAIALAVIILINIIVSFFDFRVDFTRDQRYSLTETTIGFLESDSLLTDKILFKIYLEGEFPAEVKRLQKAVRDKLDEFKYYAGSRVEYEFINPNKGTLEDQEALKEQLFDRGQGIRPVDITYRSQGASNIIEIFPGAVVEYRGNTVGHIRFLEGGQYRLDARLEQMVQRGINDLEYKFMRVLAKATRQTKKKVAFIHGHGELGIPYTQGARKNIEDAYIIDDVKIEGALGGLDQYDGIIIADPKKKFSDKDKFVIDQYLMQGGNIMVFNNPLSINNDTIRRTGKTHSARKRTGIGDLMYDYGIKINEDLVIDANYDPFAMPGLPKGFVNWYFYVRAMGTEHPISSMVNPVKLPYASSLQFVQTKNKTRPSVILTSSSNSRSFGNVPLLSIAMENQFGENPVFQDDPTNEANRLMLGGIVEGEFQSAFKNRIVSAYADSPDAILIEESEKPGKVMVVGNGTFFKNTYYDSVFVQEENKFRYIPRLPRGREIDELFAGRPIGNFEFFENCVDYMLGESTLLSIRSRAIDLHPTDKLKIEREGSFYKFINIAIPVLFILVMATIVFIVRRYKYVKK
ncbi:GldG family protein [Brumimicrobium sp.]|uniref:GldG family protein n=1 Tax=Brumimicrobium sp. TaxID=2029867 RepID=UPI003A9533AC